MQYTVMIVEDDEVIAEMVKEDLERWDYEVWIASDFKKAMQNKSIQRLKECISKNYAE